jgi:hypothetical protein
MIGEIITAVIVAIMAAIMSIPFRATVTWFIPRFNARLSKFATAQRAQKVKRLQETFWKLQDIRTGKQTHLLIVSAAAVIILTISLATLIILAAQGRSTLILTYSHRSPASVAIFHLPRSAVPAIQVCLEIWMLILGAALICILASTAKWARRIYSDEYFEEYREFTEEKLNKLGSSLTEIEVSQMKAKTESAPGLLGLNASFLVFFVSANPLRWTPGLGFAQLIAQRCRTA